MIDAFTPRGLVLLGRFLSRPALLAFDLDGTLAPIRADPAAVEVRPETRRLLAALCAARPCAVVTGRPRRDALRLLRGTGLELVVGSHGAEWPGEPVPAKWRRQVASWRRALATALEGLPGVRFEAKPAALSVHYRRCRDRAAALRAIESAARLLPGCRLARGLLVVNLAPQGAPDKGAALRRAARELGLGRALYVGDDEGDEDAFAARGLEVLGVRIGRRRRSRAALCLSGQRRLDSLLSALLGASGRRD
ncbi:MAG TPA: trehalose-phosphatase [Myxococcales bacterium]